MNPAQTKSELAATRVYTAVTEKMIGVMQAAPLEQGVREIASLNRDYCRE